MSSDQIGPFTVARFDRAHFSIERLQEMASLPGGMEELSRLRARVSTKRDVLATYLIEQIAEADELLQRCDLILSEGIRA